MRLEVHAMLRGTATLLFLALVILPGGAEADAIFGLQWRDTGSQTLTVLPGDPAAGGQRTLDVVMTLDLQWTAFGVTVALPVGSSLGFAGGGHWEAVEVPGATWWYAGPPMVLDQDQLDWINDHGLGPYQEAYEYATLMNPPNAPPWAPPGTYVVGSVLVDTSAVSTAETIETFFMPAVDGLIIDDGTGTPIYSDDATFLNATLGTARLLVVPEPATGALLAAGFLLLSLAHTRTASIRTPPKK
jgi:hypothetical protein